MNKILNSLLLSIGLTNAMAQGNIVLNGGFENLFAAWQGTFGYIDRANFALEGEVVGVVTDLGSSSINQTMHQILPTDPNVPYVLRFSLLSGAGRAGEQSPPGASLVRVKWGEDTIGLFANESVSEWKSYEFSLTADSSQTELNFASLGERFQLIDSISVTAVPEPSPIALATLGALAYLTIAGSKSFRRQLAKSTESVNRQPFTD